MFGQRDGSNKHYIRTIRSAPIESKNKQGEKPMTKNEQLKNDIFNVIENTFAENFLGYCDKKLYLEMDGVQFAIAITAPKKTVDFAETAGKTKEESPAAAQLQESERDRVLQMLQELKAI